MRATRGASVAASSFDVGGASSVGAATAPALDEQAAPLFSPEEGQDFRARWDTIQVSFVDEPRRVVEQADSLVAVAMKGLAEMFAAVMSRPRISVLHCVAIGRSSAAFSRCSNAGAV